MDGRRAVLGQSGPRCRPAVPGGSRAQGGGKEDESVEGEDTLMIAGANPPELLAAAEKPLCHNVFY